MLLIPETPYFPPPTILYTILLYGNTDTVDMCDTCQTAAEVFSCSKLLPRAGSDCVATHPAAILGMYVSMYSHHFYRTDLASTITVANPPRGQLFFSFLFSLISLIANGPHHYHPACGHKGSFHLSPVHALQFFIAMQVQHSYNSSTNG